MPPKIATRHDRATGVLPVSASARAASGKQPTTRLKLEIRRLPPGLTLAEFEETLGEEWKLHQGKVDWREYRQGKIRPPGKLSEQSRCYIHVINEAAIKEFEQRFLAVVFHDKAGTHKLQELKYLSPTLGYAMNQRVPLHGRQRVDNRQGTIDQDPEFIAFLEAETQPIAKSTALEFDKDDAKPEIKSTPLIDDLRERKANKAKAAASKAEKKGHKRGESKEPAGSAKDAKGKDKIDVKKVEQTAKEATKVVNKTSATKQAQATNATAAASPARKRRERVPASPKPASVTPVSLTTPAAAVTQRTTPATRPKRDAEGIKKMLQKDLGIKPKDSPPTGPARSRGNTQASTQRADNPPTQAISTPRVVTKAPAGSVADTTSAPRAFLKHANPSQGMTEVLIQEALAQYGEVSNVIIDTRKGTAIAVFTSTEGLQKAIAAKKVSVASGAVEVLEFRDRSGNAAAKVGPPRAPRRERPRPSPAASTAVSSGDKPAG